eukprot:gnl/MRDRNA2_/MRDRNA2_158792_c0_seq1.p1 gnl/MRDRNA2_/MRDRNA2_158792_c0~~gnl/MRDRNA2_/MRDRNA2_158792_c0_seq1.p1  ORF type:complete len:233 (-),score=33.54 gnl/MRDRNA2_/MRDRNA2_158792_c0_seq1:622-1320(-)
MPGCAYAAAVLVRRTHQRPVLPVCNKKQVHGLAQRSIQDEETFLRTALVSRYFLSAELVEEFDGIKMQPGNVKACRSSNEDRGLFEFLKRRSSSQNRISEVHQRGCKYRREVKTTEITVDPWKVMFSKPSINDKFSCGRSLEATIQALQKGDIGITEIPMITVIQQGGCFVTLDHRRLYCFRAALPKGTAIPVMLLKTRWLAHRSIAPNAKVYSAVRVERVKQPGERVCILE